MKIGDKVVVTDPNDFIAEVRNKVKDGRVGEIIRLRDDDAALVSFPKVGRRKEYRHAFRFSFLTLVEPTAEQAPTASSPSKPKL